MGEPTLATMMPDTDFFEIESNQVGTRFGIWVTKPPNYEEISDRRYPAVYIPDANLLFGSLAPASSCAQDPIWPIEPVLQVMVGYTGNEAGDAGTLRNRDLLPPDEPVAPEMADYVESFVERGVLTREAADVYLQSLRGRLESLTSSSHTSGPSPNAVQPRSLTILLKRSIDTNDSVE